MKDSRPLYISGSKGKTVDRFTGTWMPTTMKQRKTGKKSSAADNPQRSWRIKRVSQKVVLFVLLPVMVIGFAWLSYIMLLRSDIFRMTMVSVKGNQVMSQQQILNRAGIRPGINLLSMNTEKLKV